MRASGSRTDPEPAPLAARLVAHVTLDIDAGGDIVARVAGQPVALGRFGAEAAERARDLHTGLPFEAFADQDGDDELGRLVRRLARRGLLEYRLGRRRQDGDLVVIEPQVADYWPRTPQLDETDILVLSRFAYLRRRADEMVIESPRAGALFRICDPAIAALLTTLSSPQPLARLRQRDDFPGLALLALLADCEILLKADPARQGSPRRAEGDDHLALWDFHDLLFHARSTEGRHANPLGGRYPHAGIMPPLPAVRPPWPGDSIDLHPFSAAQPDASSPMAKRLRERVSTRDFDDRRPITLAELARFLDGAARIQSKWQTSLDASDGSPVIPFTVRPYPSAGSSYELELYLTVNRCEGLERGFYHYDPDGHALTAIAVPAQALDALSASAEFAMDVLGPPQILITIAARFGRVSWKYSAIAYALILKNVGVLTQSFYLMATDIGLGGCAIGSVNIDLFAKMTGLPFHIEGAVGQFAMGRGLTSGAPG